MVLFHPDYTVGPGITPDLLTQAIHEETQGARGLYRRWGIAPRPENRAKLAWLCPQAKTPNVADR